MPNWFLSEVVSQFALWFQVISRRVDLAHEMRMNLSNEWLKELVQVIWNWKYLLRLFFSISLMEYRSNSFIVTNRCQIVFPVCKSGQITTYHVARGELIQVPCEIEAYPTDLIFHWTFNGSRDFADIPGSNYVADRLKSALSYRPVTDQVIPWTAFHGNLSPTILYDSFSSFFKFSTHNTNLSIVWFWYAYQFMQVLVQIYFYRKFF